MPSAYGYRWRTFYRPQTVARDFYECVRCAMPDRPMGLRSALDVAHLDGDTSHNEPENLATLCRKCHRKHDFLSWARKRLAWVLAKRERRIDAKDRARPILEYLKEAV